MTFCSFLIYKVLFIFSFFLFFCLSSFLSFLFLSIPYPFLLLQVPRYEPPLDLPDQTFVDHFTNSCLRRMRTRCSWNALPLKCFNQRKTRNLQEIRELTSVRREMRKSQDDSSGTCRSKTEILQGTFSCSAIGQFPSTRPPIAGSHYSLAWRNTHVANQW